ncbi:hypothetical protein ALO53_200051 [Pseudomonas amygdali pv. photiniae]|uniref:Uncharacterized protein n=1 Tax=Pseudomonas amygdali pv. photiniae TaxID=251724 RepID=A0A0P9SQW8_PSEA0|nr:hypothetical protein ALO53_200051 [Pseudomonas amygdali pv. photiniae]
MQLDQFTSKCLIAETTNGGISEKRSDFTNHDFLATITCHALAVDIAAKQLLKGRVKIFHEDSAHGAEANQRLLGLGQEAEVVNDLVLLCCCHHRSYSIQLVLGYFHGLGEQVVALEEVIDTL